MKLKYKLITSNAPLRLTVATAFSHRCQVVRNHFKKEILAVLAFDSKYFNSFHVCSKCERFNVQSAAEVKDFLLKY